MSDITIPSKALEAAAKELCEATFKVSEYGPWESTPQWMQDMWRNRARAACLTMLKAWPGVGSIRVDQPIGEWCEKLPAIILPLTETDDEPR